MGKYQQQYNIQRHKLRKPYQNSKTAEEHKRRYPVHAMLFIAPYKGFTSKIKPDNRRTDTHSNSKNNQ